MAGRLPLLAGSRSVRSFRTLAQEPLRFAAEPSLPGPGRPEVIVGSMEVRPVARTDLEVSRLVMGTMTFGSQVDQQGAAEMVGRCLDEGINMFDTANAYNEGRSEEILGKLIAPHRADVLIATKVFNPMGDAQDDRGL